MGEVWVADGAADRESVVVKFVADDELDAEASARFSREAALLSSVRSPHVVTLLDHGTYGSQPYIVMEHLEGEDLARRLERVGKLPLAAVHAIVRQLADALTAIHALGALHRDVKPGNIFLCKTDGEELVKLLDFGIAKRASQDLGDASTKTGTLLGTPFYMSPEQLAGKKTLDVRSDLWAVGVVAFEALTGRRPFVADTLGELVLLVHSMPAPPRLADVEPSLPAEIDAWFARACATAPADRFASASELAEAFGAAMRGRAAAPTTSRALPMAIGLGCLVVGIALTTTWAVRARPPPPAVQASAPRPDPVVPAIASSLAEAPPAPPAPEPPTASAPRPARPTARPPATATATATAKKSPTTKYEDIE